MNRTASRNIGERVYLVVWDAQRIVKVGYTSQRRFRSFLSRGARIHSLTLFRNGLRALDYEAEVEHYLATVGRRAFTGKWDAVPFLGVHGCGWTECYVLPDLALLDGMPPASPEHCLPDPAAQYLSSPPGYAASNARTDVRTDLRTNYSPFEGISPNASRAGGLHEIASEVAERGAEAPPSELIRGICPACGSASLFVGAGGYVTCSWIECADPIAPSKALGVVFAELEGSSS